jgi:hypothetical protein
MRNMASKKEPQESAPASIDELIATLDDWRGERLAEIRSLIHGELPDVTETWKWMGSPVWEHHGIIAVGNAHKAKVKLTFPQGAHLEDRHRLFNAGLDGKAGVPSTSARRTRSTTQPSAP